MRDTVFKAGMTLAYIAEIIFLSWSIYRGFTEFNGTSVEAIGLYMVVVCGVVGCGALLFGLQGILSARARE